MRPEPVQRKRTKGYKLPPNTKSVCRPGKWGNPYKIGDDCADARTAVIRYEQDLIGLVFKDRFGTPLLNQISELRGYNLACFCSLDQPCHRNILLKYANGVYFDYSPT